MIHAFSMHCASEPCLQLGIQSVLATDFSDVKLSQFCAVRKKLPRLSTILGSGRRIRLWMACSATRGTASAA
jgi:hypothetical protein